MERKFVSSAEVIYIGYFKFKAEGFPEANKKAEEILNKLQVDKDFPYTIGKDTRLYFGDIRIDNVEYNFGDEYLANINLQYVGDFKVYAEDGSEAWEYAQELLDGESIPDSFGTFELEQKLIYDSAPYEWQ